MKRLTPILLMLMLCISLPCFSQSVEHVVDVGETFESIAQKYGMTEQQLKEANPKYRGVFYVGMKLNIPQKYANPTTSTPQAQQSPEPQEETVVPQQTTEPQQASALEQSEESKQTFAFNSEADEGHEGHESSSTNGEMDNNEPPKNTPFPSENDFLASFFVGGEDFHPGTGKTQLVRLHTLLSNRGYGKNKADIENAKVICAYNLTHPSYRTVGIYDILEHYPEIAAAKNVPLTWDGSQVVDMNDAYMQYLRHLRDSDNTNALFNYHYIYHDWGNMTEEEKTECELNFVLKNDPGRLNLYYKKYFPEGHFVGMDFNKEGWAMAYIFYCQRILRKNDPKIWVGRNDYRKFGISRNDWMHYPRLSQNIGEYSKDTNMSRIFRGLKEAPRDLMFNKRTLSFLQALFTSSKYIFAIDGDMYRAGVFRILKEGGVNDVAKTYRVLMDAIGLAVLIDDDIGVATDNTNYPYSYAKWSGCHIAAENMIEGYAASVALAESEPKILPACKKAQEVFKSKLALLQKKVFIHDDKWAAAISRYNQEQQTNKEAYNKMCQEIEDLSLPQYEYGDDTWQKQPNGDFTRQIFFPDLTGLSGTHIIKNARGTYYQARTGAFLHTKYKTERDAIIASYAYLKYGEVRQKGRL